MTFDRTAYQREYMRRKRAGQPTAKPQRMESALTDIIAKLDGNDKPLAITLRGIAEEGLR